MIALLYLMPPYFISKDIFIIFNATLLYLQGHPSISVALPKLQILEAALPATGAMVLYSLDNVRVGWRVQIVYLKQYTIGFL